MVGGRLITRAPLVPRCELAKPPYSPTPHYIRIPSIGPCVREQSGRNSCSTRSSIVSKMLFLRHDLSSSRFHHFDSPFRVFERIAGPAWKTDTCHMCANFTSFFFLLLLLFPVLQPPRISCAMIRVIRYIRLNFVSSIRKGIGEFFDAGLEDLIYYYLNC